MQDGAPGEWFRAAVSGDADAWTHLVERYNPMLWAVARSHRLSTTEAAEIVQTSWLRLLENCDRIRDPDRVGGWLGVTARNECLAYLRRQSRIEPGEMDADTLVDLRGQPGDAIVEREKTSALWAAVDSLSERCRRLLRLLASDPPPSYVEVSEIMDMALGSIGPVRARCLESLRRHLASDPHQADLLGPT